MSEQSCCASCGETAAHTIICQITADADPAEEVQHG